MPILALLAGLALAPADTVRLVLVATTDVHGQVTDWDYLRNTSAPGGLARAATVIDSLRERYPGQVVVVDAGNALAGNPLAAYYGRETSRDPHPVIEAMNLVGYDAATPGDRDFDFGAERFNRSIAGATFHWVSANLQVLPADTLAFSPFVVVQRNGVRVAIAGLTTPGAMVWNGPRLRDRFRVNRIELAAERTLRSMREYADLTVVLCNSGLGGPSSYDTTGIGGENVAGALAQPNLRPDLVVVGHSEQEIADSVFGGVHFVQPRPDGASLAIVRIAMVSRGGKLVPVRMVAERAALQDVRASPRLQRRLAEPHAAVLQWVSTRIGEAQGRFSLVTARVEDTPLMRFLLEALRRTTGADLSALPVLDIRTGLDPGEVTVGEVFRLYPYEYALRSVRITGDDLKAYLEQSARYWFVDSTGKVFTNRYLPPDRYDLVGGATYTVDLSQPMGSRVVSLSVHGRPVLPADTFTLALPDNRQQGQGGPPGLNRAPVVYDKGVTVREALLAAIARRKPLRPEDFQGRDWSLGPAELAKRARALFVRGPSPGPSVDSTPEPIALPLARSREEQRIQDSLDRARQRVDSIAAVVVATLRLPAEAGAGGGLGRLLADAYRNQLRADVAVVQGSEVGTRLPAKGLTAADIDAAVPGDATLLTIHLKGANLSDLLENALAGPSPCCEFSGIQVEYDPKAKPYERVRRVRFTSTGRSLEEKQTYAIALSTRLLSGDGFPLGASDCRAGKGCKTPGDLSRWGVDRTTQTPAEVLREYLRHLRQPVTPPEDQRLLPSR
jgi:2',3'-cyclic-nucleotide 2'-phosphodiesterase/3'-nucleotidase